MNFKLSTIAKVIIPLCSVVAVVGCNDSSSSDAKASPETGGGYFDTTNAPKINIVLPETDGAAAKLPVSGPVDEPVKADSDEAVIYYVMKDGNVDAAANYDLYIWNDETCDRADKSVTHGWDDQKNKPAGKDKLGPYWRLPVKAGKTDCINFILRDENKDKLLGGNSKLSLTEFSDRTASYVAGNTNGMDSREEAFIAVSGISNAEAHLVDGHTLVWEKAKNAKEVRLYVSLGGNIEPEKDYTFDEQYIVLKSSTLSEGIKSKFPVLANQAAFSIDADIDMRPVMKAELVAMAVDEKGQLIAATKVQSAGALDQLFAGAAQKADLGAMLTDDGTQFKLWAPSAQNVVTVLFDENKKELGRLQMAYDEQSGIWSLTTDKAASGTYYRYLVNVFHPLSGKVESYQVTDPYSLSLSMNSEFSQVIDLNDPSLKPDGWDELQRPVKQDNPADFVIYESHVRDFSALDQSTPETLRGKYGAFTQTDSVPVNHLKSLKENGTTHLHLLPFFDIATINEDPAKVAEIDQPFSKLCDVNSGVKESRFKQYCSSEKTIADVLETIKADDSPTNPVVQELNRFVSQTDGFNWGYDPFHYTVPEGSYSTDADGTKRILELREAIKAVKENVGMNVVMDVVYNHTNSAGPDAKTSVLDKIVPWYYNRLDEITGSVKNSTCCSNTAPEHAMMEKLITDSLVVWARDYKIDSFRFDLMGHHPLSQIQNSLEAVKKVDPNTYFYGEGWNFGEVENDRLFTQATQKNLGGTGIGSYSDRLRDAVRGGTPFDGKEDIRKNQGFGNGAYVLKNDISETTKAEALHNADIVRLGMAGNLKDFVMIDSTGLVKHGDKVYYSGNCDEPTSKDCQYAGYAEDPTEVLNYVSKHDNQTLWDNNQYKIDYSLRTLTRVRMQAVSLATVMLGQGVPFTQMGAELLRSKSMQRDSYDSGDWYNKVDFTLQDNNWDKGLPRKDKDGDNYSVITDVINGAAESAKPYSEYTEQMVEFFKELTDLRQQYPLITLGKGSEVKARVDFHNTGADQVPGLIVMSIDNGQALNSDIDPNLDAMVIVINATPEQQDFTLNGVTGLELSPLHKSELASGATVKDSTLSVPAWTPAVFIQPRGNVRGTGIPVVAKN